MKNILLLLLISFLFSCNSTNIKLDVLEIENLRGKAKSISEYQGKMVFLNFWATWCGPCLKEMPSLEIARKKIKKRLRICDGI